MIKQFSNRLWYELNRVSWSPENEVKQYSIAYEIFSIMFRMPYYKKQSATLCEKYGISRFYKIKKENTYFQ